jgi:excisionase family DNA binding protein
MRVTQTEGAKVAARPPVESPLFTLKEAAQFLNVSERRVRYLWDKRDIYAVKFGTTVMFRKTVLSAYIDAQDTALKTNY